MTPPRATAGRFGPDHVRGPLLLLSCAVILCTDTAHAGQAMTVSVTNGAAPSVPYAATAAFPGELAFSIQGPTSTWANLATLEVDLVWPDGAPTNAQVLAYLKDWDHWWYQSLLPDRLVPGRTNVLVVPLLPGNADWQARGHYGAWNLRALMAPREVGVRVFTDTAYRGTVTVTRVEGTPAVLTGPPLISRVRASAEQVPCYERFEITFDLPDRYPCPFNPDAISVDGVFTAPDGTVLRVPAFFAQDYFRRSDAAGDQLVPQGAPYWKCRFAPRLSGAHVYRLEARDALGTNTWGPGRLTATEAVQPGYVRVSKRDPRAFEFDDGTFFLPIGHNIRSPYDTRMEEQFPWTRRWPSGSSVYVRYFKAMREHGENMTEVWSAPWSFGLEWISLWRGYHGIDQYNLMHAWELDTVVREAERQGVSLNLVIHNHGKFGTGYDHEWEHNPLNVKQGGYLSLPEEYFTDPRARASFLRLMRYMVARWGYSTRIFSWQLWSELDLTGSGKDKIENYRRPEVVEWHAWAGREIKAMDPWDHLVSTHVCGDYTHQNADILALPEIDHAAVDAYHFSPDPLHIVPLLKQTAQHNAQFKKPVIVTEFGGSPYAQDVRHLADTLHAGLWASACVPLGGAPLFWWWQLIDEENFYPEFRALSAFMAGEDRRDPAFQSREPELFPNPPAARLAVECLGHTNRALGWIHLTQEFPNVETAGLGPITNLSIRFSGLATGAPYTAEFWNTSEGVPLPAVGATATNGVVAFPVPPFVRDIAFKLWRVAEGE